MALTPVAFHDSNFFGPLDPRWHKNLRDQPMTGDKARRSPGRSNIPIVSVSSVVAGERRITFVPVGHRNTVRPVIPADFPIADLSALEHG